VRQVQRDKIEFKREVGVSMRVILRERRKRLERVNLTHERWISGAEFKVYRTTTNNSYMITKEVLISFKKKRF
jgi:hypothetical protein